MRIELPAWLDGKRREVADAEPLSIQQNVAVLSARLWAAEQALEQVRRLHSNHDDCPDGFEDCAGVGLCRHCHRPWPCPTRRLVDGGSDEC